MTKGVYSPLRTNSANIQPYWRPSTWRRWTPYGTNTPLAPSDHKR